MNDTHVKVFKLTKENISKKFQSPGSELEFLPEFRLFMKQKEPYNNYLHQRETIKKQIINYPIIPSSAPARGAKELGQNVKEIEFSPRISEPSPLTNIFFRQQEMIQSQQQPQIQRIQIQKNPQSQQNLQNQFFPGNFIKEQEQNQSNFIKKDIASTIHSRSLNSRQHTQQQQQYQHSPNNLNNPPYRKQNSPKFFTQRTQFHNQDQLDHSQSNSSMKTEMPYLKSHPQFKQAKMLQIQNCFKGQQGILQNKLIQQEMQRNNIHTDILPHSDPANNQIMTQNYFYSVSNHKNNIENNSIGDGKQNNQNKSSLIQNQNDSQKQVKQNLLNQHNSMIQNDSFCTMKQQPYHQNNQLYQNQQDSLQQNSVQMFMKRRNHFIGNNICNKGRPQSSKLYKEQKSNLSGSPDQNQINVSIPSKNFNKFLIKGFQYIKS